MGSPIMWKVGITGLGILTGALFPLFIMLGCSLFPQNSGSASSFVGVAFALGSALFPYALGFVAEFVDLEVSIYISVLALAGYRCPDSGRKFDREEKRKGK